MRVIPADLVPAPDDPLRRTSGPQRVIARLMRSPDDIALGHSGAHAIVSPAIPPYEPLDLKPNEFLYVARLLIPARGEYGPTPTPARILSHTLVAGSSKRPRPIQYAWPVIRRVVTLSGLPAPILDKARQDQLYLVAAFVWTLLHQSGRRRQKPTPTPALDALDAS